MIVTYSGKTNSYNIELAHIFWSIEVSVYLEAIWDYWKKHKGQTKYIPLPPKQEIYDKTVLSPGTQMQCIVLLERRKVVKIKYPPKKTDRKLLYIIDEKTLQKYINNYEKNKEMKNE